MLGEVIYYHRKRSSPRTKIGSTHPEKTHILSVCMNKGKMKLLWNEADLFIIGFSQTYKLVCKGKGPFLMEIITISLCSRSHKPDRAPGLFLPQKSRLFLASLCLSKDKSFCLTVAQPPQLIEGTKTRWSLRLPSAKYFIHVRK